MSLLPAIYRPTGSCWRRFCRMMVTGYINCHLRWEERQDGQFYRQLERL